MLNANYFNYVVYGTSSPNFSIIMKAWFRSDAWAIIFDIKSYEGYKSILPTINFYFKCNDTYSLTYYVCSSKTESQNIM